VNSWLFILANGLLPEYKKCKDGVSFSEPDYDSIPKLKAKIMKEENVLGIPAPESKTFSNVDLANSVSDNCSSCNIKGHKKSECRKFKKQKEEKAAKRESYWCDQCQVKGHTTDYC
jgi:hypothetical protein